MQVGIIIAVRVDVPMWALHYLPAHEHWQLAWQWLDVSLRLMCY
ncbi:hypothetical protein [Parahaliea aestuarii]|nr:hypothetical protein [Parahaliea aestuarii]